MFLYEVWVSVLFLSEIYLNANRYIFTCFRVEQSSELPSIATDVDLPSTNIEKVPLSIHTGTILFLYDF